VYDTDSSATCDKVGSKRRIWSRSAPSPVAVADFISHPFGVREKTA
jgi:hypothetical protein